MAHVLIVDDEHSICWGLGKLISSIGHTSAAVSSAEQGFSAVATRRPDVIVLDVRLPGMDGIAAIAGFRERIGAVPIIVVTAYGELDTAVDAIRNGAFEYLVKPFDLALAQRTIERAIASTTKLASAPPVVTTAPAAAGEIVGSSPGIQEVFKRIALVAPTDACVHVSGESGVGKELVARAIHKYSRRVDGPFISVNVASLSPTLAESELFGHVRGAFTGAEQNRKGLLEQADGGSIFFDEVADIPLSVQVKLLRVLEYGEILPVGSEKAVQSDFRVISATHQDLRQRVAEGAFRQDLYFRLITFQIDIPPLRARRSDLRDLTDHFLSVLARKNETAKPAVSQMAIAALEERSWTGNVRELRNALEHAMILARGGTILPEHLPTAPTGAFDRDLPGRIISLVRDWTERELERQPDATDLYERMLKIVEPPLIDAVLERSSNQFLSAARKLGLHRETLRKKANQHRESSDS